MRKELLKTLSGDKRTVALIVIGSVSWVLTMIKSGLPIATGLGFWGANGHDGIWHLALAQSLGRASLEMPTFAGNPLQNYHIGFDLLLAGLWKVTMIPVSVWYFQILPIIFSLLIGILTYRFMFVWKGSKSIAFWSTFFVYFGGDFGFLVTLWRGNGIGGESMFWSQQGISSLINPPFALSLIFLLVSFISLNKYLKSSSKVWLLITALLFGSLIEIKVYAGALALGGLFVLAIQQFLLKRSFKIAVLFCISLFISILLFLPLNSNASSVLVFQPFWFLETMLALSDRFYWPKLYEALINWRAAHVYSKAFMGYLVALILFIVGNLGTRILTFFAFIPRKKSLKKLSDIDVFSLLFLVIGAGGFLFPLLFVQAGTAWNTIQFFYYTLFVCAILSGIGLTNFLKKISNNNLKRVFVACVVILTIPTSASTLLLVYLPGRPPAQLPTEEQEALTFLKSQPDGIVLTYPFDPIKAKEAISNPPRPLYLYESSAYVSAYANKRVFLEDEVNLTIMGYSWKERRASTEEFYRTYDHQLAKDFLIRNNITYVYWTNAQRATVGDLQLGLQNIFENKKVIIYRVIQ